MRLMSLVLACSLTIFGLFCVFYAIPPQKSIVTFDKEEVLSQFIRQLAEAKATESQVAQSTRRFNALLNNVLIDTAHKEKVIILRASDVLVGGVDITNEVRIKLSRAMRNKS